MEAVIDDLNGLSDRACYVGQVPAQGWHRCQIIAEDAVTPSRIHNCAA